MDFFLILYKSRLFYFSTGTGSVSPKKQSVGRLCSTAGGIGGGITPIADKLSDVCTDL